MRLKQIVPQWQSITSDQSILNSVKHYTIKFDAGVPQQQVVPREISFTHLEQSIVDQLVNKGVVFETTPSEGEYISTVFIRPKKDGTHRLIMN